MDNQHLRSTLLKLQDRLSDNDRQRLHFFLGDDIPRRIRDNPTLTGTLNLMECLFDQDKINDRDFTFLINAFKEIQCIDAVKLLGEYKQQMQSNCCHQPTLQSIMPRLNEQIVRDQEEDKSASESLLPQINNYGNYNKIINRNSTNINPVTITVDNQKVFPVPSKENPSVHISLKISKYFCFVIFLFIIVVGMLLTVLTWKNHQTRKSDLRSEYESLLEKQRQMNKTISAKDQQIERLNSQLIPQTGEKDTSLIVAGRQFGIGSGGQYFDDSRRSDFTCSHYLSGFYARDHGDALESYQFYYTSPADRYPLESLTHGTQTESFKKKFDFPKDERITEVKGRVVQQSVLTLNGTNTTMSIITGIQFTSNKGRTSPAHESNLGEEFTDKREGYTLGYATGHAGQYIEQVQFFWYRMEEKESEED